MLNYDYEMFLQDMHRLVEEVKPFDADTIVAITRGGLAIGQLMAYGLDIRNLQSLHVESYDEDQQRAEVTLFGSCDFSRSRRVLIVDDIVDSGKTLHAVMQKLGDENPSLTFKTAAIFYKPTAVICPDYTLHEATEWIGFFWEKDFSPA